MAQECGECGAENTFSGCHSDIHTPDKRPTPSFSFGAQQADVKIIFTELLKSLFFYFNNGVRDVLSQHSSSSKLSFPNPGLTSFSQRFS